MAVLCGFIFMIRRVITLLFTLPLATSAVCSFAFFCSGRILGEHCGGRDQHRIFDVLGSFMQQNRRQRSGSAILRRFVNVRYNSRIVVSIREKVDTNHHAVSIPCAHGNLVCGDRSRPGGPSIRC